MERLLASPHYGEHWARHWLDAAQYADSDGFERTPAAGVGLARLGYPVVQRGQALRPVHHRANRGDHSPGQQNQRVATGFLRNSMINEEGASIRSNSGWRRYSTGWTWWGAGSWADGGVRAVPTHKYDPLTHTEYYGLLAFLNDADEGNIPVYSAKDEAQRTKLFR